MNSPAYCLKLQFDLFDNSTCPHPTLLGVIAPFSPSDEFVLQRTTPIYATHKTKLGTNEISPAFLNRDTTTDDILSKWVCVHLFFRILGSKSHRSEEP